MKRLLVLLAMGFLLCGSAYAEARQMYGVSRGPAPAKVLTVRTVRYGGVLFSAKSDTQFSDGRDGVPVNHLTELTYDEDGTLCFMIARDCFALDIAEDDLARIASFVHNNATGAYSAYPLGSEVQMELGVRACESIAGFCALEFVGSPHLEGVLRVFDFAPTGYYPDAEMMAMLLNSEFPDDVGRVPVDWEVMDEYSGFTAMFDVRSKSVSFDGAMLRFYRSIAFDTDNLDAGTIDDLVSGYYDLTRASAMDGLRRQGVQFYENLYVEQVEIISRPGPDDLDKALRNLEKGVCQSTESYARVQCQSTREKYASYRMFEDLPHQIALLRTVKESRPDVWSQFVNSFFD